jgi:hypothetical protein
MRIAREAPPDAPRAFETYAIANHCAKSFAAQA